MAPSVSRIIHRLSAIPHLTAALILMALLISACEEQESPKKVSLFQRGGDGTGQQEQIQPNILWFGFDLRLGPKEEVSIYIPFLRYLENATGRRFRMKFTRRYEDTLKDLGEGHTHFAAMDSLSYVIGSQEYGIGYLVSGVNKEGDPRSRAVIITSPGSGVTTLEDLRGRCFAFGSRMSTLGYLVPRKMLEDAGVSLTDLMQYLYTDSPMNALMSVMNGECDAGSINDALAQQLSVKGGIVVLKTSEPYPSNVIAFSTATGPKIVDDVRGALLAFEPAGAHKGLIEDWDQTEMPLGFTRIGEVEMRRVTTLARTYGMLRP